MSWEDALLIALEIDPLEATEYERQVMVAAYFKALRMWRDNVWKGAPESVLRQMRDWINAAAWPHEVVN